MLKIVKLVTALEENTPKRFLNILIKTSTKEQPKC